LSCFLQDLQEPMGRKERRHWARVYVEGLLLDGERKSIEPLAARLAGADVQALPQFVGQTPWAVEEVGRRPALKMVDLPAEAEVWMVDDTSSPKARKHSVGVAWLPAVCLERRGVLQCSGSGDVAAGSIGQAFPKLSGQGRGLPGRGENQAPRPR